MQMLFLAKTPRHTFLFKFDNNDPKLSTKLSFKLIEYIHMGLLNHEQAENIYAQFIISNQSNTIGFLD